MSRRNLNFQKIFGVVTAITAACGLFAATLAILTIFFPNAGENSYIQSVFTISTNLFSSGVGAILALVAVDGAATGDP